MSNENQKPPNPFVGSPRAQTVAKVGIQHHDFRVRVVGPTPRPTGGPVGYYGTNGPIGPWGSWK